MDILEEDSPYSETKPSARKERRNERPKDRWKERTNKGNKVRMNKKK
jgi:IS5 family transposase